MIAHMKRNPLFAMFILAALAVFPSASSAQYGAYGGGGFNQYNQSGIGTNSGYGGSQYNPVGGYGGSSYGGSSYGGGYGGSSFGGSSFGGSRFGGSSFGSSSFGSSRMGGGMSSRSGRSSRRGGSSYGQSGYGQSGYDTGGYSSRSSRGRSSRSSRGGGNYVNYNNPYGGNFQNQGNPNDPGQTAPSQVSGDRRQALSGANARGAMPGGQGSGGASDSGIQIQGTAGGGQTGAAPGQPGAAPGQQRGGRKAQATETQFRTRDSAMLYLKPARSVTGVSEPVRVDVVLANSARVEYDEVRFQLKYDPNRMQVVDASEPGGWTPLRRMRTIPTDSEQTELDEANNMSGNNTKFLLDKTNNPFVVQTNRVNAEAGTIDFAMSAPDGKGNDAGIIARFSVLPLVVDDSADMRFQFTDVNGEAGSVDNLLTYLKLKGEDKLGSSYDPADGVIHLDLSVMSSMGGDGERARQKITRSDGERRFEDDENATGSMQLQLIPRQPLVDVGDTLEVDVYLSNPLGEEFDAVSLLLAFNPRVLQPIDADEYASGINIDNEAAKAEFSFDFPLLNSVDADKGLVDYRRRSMRKPLTGEGVIATMRFRAVKPTAKTTFRILVNGEGEDPTTGVFHRGGDRLGAPSDPYDGFATTSLAIRPTMAYINKLKEAAGG